MNAANRFRVAAVVSVFSWAALAARPSAILADEAQKVSKTADKTANSRRPKDDAGLRFWLENMVWQHRYSIAEIAAATSLKPDEIKSALAKFEIRAETKPKRRGDAPLLVLPYPGGRHPRVGFLDGAVDPQRETKASVFTPWDETSYVVVDVPEAIWQERELLYLAHTHIATVWTKKSVALEPLEWTRGKEGRLEIERKLPNGVVLAAKVAPSREAVRMELSLTNGTRGKLTGLRVQNCVLLKGAAGFDRQTNKNKTLSKPYIACRAEKDDRWIITAWENCDRVWANEPCPCMHSDPKFPDCEPGKTVRLKGWLSFYQGKDLDAEIKRIEAIGWR